MNKFKKFGTAAFAAAMLAAQIPYSAFAENASDTITVSVLVLGDTAHEVTEDNKHTLSGGGLTEWLRGDYEIGVNDTAWDVLQAAFEENGITCENPSGSYINSVTKDGVTLAAFTNGELCGWMYNLNGGWAMNGVSEQSLEDGDSIVLYFTDDFYAEDGSEDPSYNTGSAPENPDNGAEKADISKLYAEAGDALLAAETDAKFSAGSEWTVIGLARSGKTIPESYYDNTLEYVNSKIDENGRLGSASSENSRVVLALTALGYDVTNVGGHNLLLGLSDLDFVNKQGANGAIWALIALDSAEYDIPETSGKTQTTREELLKSVLAAQLENGGWTYYGEEADPDLTAMALTALAPYCGEISAQADGNGGEISAELKAEIKATADKAVALLSEMQFENGGFGGADGVYSESCAQVITALTALGIDPETDARFIKNGRTVLDALAELSENGGFKHTAADSETNSMSTEQGYYALTAFERFKSGKTSLYDMTDVIIRNAENGENSAPSDNHPTGISVSITAFCAALSAAAVVAAARKRK